jgi:S1-C subfamily serine protease
VSLPRSNVKPLALAAAALAMLAPLALAAPPREPHVVAVRVLQPGGSAEIATGVVVAPERVLTVAHVLERGREISAAGAPATVARLHPGQDLALLAVPGARGPAVGHASASGPLRVLLRRGDGIIARPVELRRRIVASLVDQPGRPRRAALELGARIRSGDSGAPVVDERGDVVGIVFARSTRRGGTAYAIRTDMAGALP